MTPFPNEEVCPKCRSENLDCEYGKHMQEDKEISDCLAWECQFCGYKWVTECADAQTVADVD
jgi:hypothetical protein